MAPPVVTIELADLRRALKIPGSELAKALGISKSYLSRIETGKRSISEELGTAIHTFFVDYIAGRV